MSVTTGYDEMNQFINYDGSKGPFRGKVAHQEGTRPMVVLVIRTIIAGIWVAFFPRVRGIIVWTGREP